MARDRRVQGAGINLDYQSESYRSMLALMHFNDALGGSVDFLGEYLPSLSINYVAMSKDMGKMLPQLYLGYF